MSKYDTPDNICIALTTFISEIREQAAALRAYDNVFRNKPCDNVFMKRSYDSIWRELLSEIARVFDKASTGSNGNCTLSRLKELCFKEQYLFLFPDAEKDNLMQSLDVVLERYNQLPIIESRNKQLAHHDMKQLFSGEVIEISLDQIEKLIENTADVVAKIYTRFCVGFFENTFPNYDILVERFENSIKELANYGIVSI